VASQRLKRTIRGALAASAIIAVISTAPTSASADPTTNSTDPNTEYQQLSQQADTLNEQLNSAKVDLGNKQSQLARANGDLAAAQSAAKDATAKEDQFRGSVDALTAASFEGARINQLSALLTGSSAKDYLNRATDLQNLADTSDQVLTGFQNAVNAATAAQARATGDQKTAQDATNAAQALVNQIQQQTDSLNTKINQVKSLISQLSASQRSSLSSTGVSGTFIGPPGIANSALQAALTRRGDPYVWGASGPNEFDCSGLIQWAYEQVGVSLPHSSQSQATMGESVSRSSLQVGDLVFFGSPVHHVGIYVGNGLMLNAPDTGQVVKVEALFSDYSGARRLSG
jgi:cell wall-associated NlpC family hydrolase